METVLIDGERLVQTAIGVLRYLPPALWVDSLGALLEQHNPKLALRVHGGGGLTTVQLWPLYEVPLRWLGGMGRLPTRRGGEVPLRQVAPEAIIETDGWLIAINCATGEEPDAELVFQDFAVARRHAGERKFALLHINAAWSRRMLAGIAMISPVDGEPDVSPRDTVARYVALRHARLGTKARTSEVQVDQHLAWLSWQSIYRLLAQIDFDRASVLEGTPTAVLDAIRRLRDDAMELLQRSRLAPTDHDIVARLAKLKVDPDAIPAIRVEEEEEAEGEDAPFRFPLPPPRRPGAAPELAASLPAAAPTRAVAPPAPVQRASVQPAPVPPEPIERAPVPAAPVRPALPEVSLPDREPAKGPPAAAPPVTTAKGRAKGHAAEDVPEPQAEASPATQAEPAPRPAPDDGWYEPDALPIPATGRDLGEDLPHSTARPLAKGDTSAAKGSLPGAQPRSARAAAYLAAAAMGTQGPCSEWSRVAADLVAAAIHPDLLPRRLTGAVDRRAKR